MKPYLSDDRLDRILGASKEIAPSSGFVSSVMEAVQREAVAPKPIPFPWRWAMPGLIVSLGLVVLFLVRLARTGTSANSSVVAAGLSLDSLRSMLLQTVSGGAVRLSVEWSVAALLVSLVAVWLSLRITNAHGE